MEVPGESCESRQSAQFTSREMSSQLDSFPLEDVLMPNCPSSQVLQLSHSMAKQNSLASGCVHFCVSSECAAFRNSKFFKFVLQPEHLLKATNLIVQRGFTCAERDTSLDSTPMMKKVATKNTANRPNWTGE